MNIYSKSSNFKLYKPVKIVKNRYYKFTNGKDNNFVYINMVQGIEKAIQNKKCEYDLEFVDKEHQDKLYLLNKIQKGINFDGIIFILVFAGSTPFGNLYAGLFAEHFNARIGFAACGAIIILLMIPLLVYKMRRDVI